MVNVICVQTKLFKASALSSLLIRMASDVETCMIVLRLTTYIKQDFKNGLANQEKTRVRFSPFFTILSEVCTVDNRCIISGLKIIKNKFTTERT